MNYIKKNKESDITTLQNWQEMKEYIVGSKAQSVPDFFKKLFALKKFF